MSLYMCVCNTIGVTHTYLHIIFLLMVMHCFDLTTSSLNMARD